MSHHNFAHMVGVYLSFIGWPVDLFAMLEPAKTSRGCSAKDSVYFADCEGRTLFRGGLWSPDSGIKERFSSTIKWIPLANGRDKDA